VAVAVVVAAAAAQTNQNGDAPGGKYIVVIIVVRFDVVRIGASTRTRTFTQSAADEDSPTRATAMLVLHDHPARTPPQLVALLGREQRRHVFRRLGSDQLLIRAIAVACTELRNAALRRPRLRLCVSAQATEDGFGA
jgi:hypothetical protein